MPLILPEETERKWLENASTAKALCLPFDEKLMEAHPVPKISPSNIDPQSEELIKPFDYPELHSFLK